MKELTFESVNQEIENLDLAAFENELEAKRLDVTSKICAVWNKIGGIVKLVAKIPLIPKKWRQALNLLINTLDSLCG